VNLLNFGEAYDDYNDMGDQCGTIREAQTIMGTFKIQATKRGCTAWLELLNKDFEPLWEEHFPNKAAAIKGCQEFYTSQARALLQEAFGAAHDVPLILTGKYARNLLNKLTQIVGCMKDAEDLMAIMDEQGVPRYD
jgi:hypothetical protein